MLRTKIAPSFYRGSLTLSRILHGRDSPELWLPQHVVHNDLTYEWGAILQRLLRGSPDGGRYVIGGMYIEFDNSGGAVTPPAITRNGAGDYYADLAAPQDYLRVPLVATAEENSDTLTYELPNVGVFLAQTTGSQGVHGLPFSNAAGSRIYGAAAVAFTDPDDSAQDIVYARAYISDPAQQLQKLTGSQIGLTWRKLFE